MTANSIARFPSRLVLALGAFAMLGGCSGERANRDTEAMTKPEGKILGGDISDDMLPLDRLRSQSPPLARESDRPAAAPSEQSAQPAASAGSQSDEGAQ